MSHENIMNIKEFRKTLAREIRINANNQSFFCCYSRCANKQLILDLYLSPNNEIIFGRRGTGKTTILKGLSYYVNQLPHDDDYFTYAIYIDMEDIVPNKIEIENSSDDIAREIYRLILLKILERFYSFFDRISVGNTYYNLVRFSDEDVNKIAELIVKLEDTVKEGSRTVNNMTGTAKTSDETLKSRSKDLQVMGTAENRSLLANLKASIARSFSKVSSSSISTETQIEYRVNINEIRVLLDQLLDACKIETLYLCLDEFTIVDKNAPISLQTNIAQLVKDTFFRNQHIIVKISSLWNREKMQVRSFGTDRRGIELGEDIKWSIDLDEIFFNSQINANTFFAELLGNIMFFDKHYICYDDTKNSEKNIALQRELSINAGNAMIKKLFKTMNTYNQLVCGSQGIPRIFCNLLSDCIMKTNKRNETVITFPDVRDAIIDNYTQGVRKKLPDGLELLGAIETFVLNQKSRFFLISIRDFQKIQSQVEGVVDANAIHQYPSANVDRRIRNRYKLFMVHYGNFMEALAGVNRSCSLENDRRCDAHLYPKLPTDIVSSPNNYQLMVGKEVFNQCFCLECKTCYNRDELEKKVCPTCGSKLI